MCGPDAGPLSSELEEFRIGDRGGRSDWKAQTHSLDSYIMRITLSSAARALEIALRWLCASNCPAPFHHVWS